MLKSFMHVKSTVVVNVANEEQVIKRLCQFYRRKKNQLLWSASFLLVVKMLKLFITGLFVGSLTDTHTHWSYILFLVREAEMSVLMTGPGARLPRGLISQWS